MWCDDCSEEFPFEELEDCEVCKQVLCGPCYDSEHHDCASEEDEAFDEVETDEG